MASRAGVSATLVAAVFFVWCLDIMVVASPNSTLYCEHFDKKTCDNDTGCVSSRMACQPNEYCFAIWQNISSTVHFVLKGCWLPSDEWDGIMECVAKPQYEKPNMSICSCGAYMCNVNVSLSTIQGTRPPTTAVSLQPGPHQLSRTLLLSLLPIALLAVVVVIVFYVCRQHRSFDGHQIPTQEPSPTIPTPPSPILPDKSLKPIQLEEVKARGRFGCVWKAKMGSQTVAVKIFPMQDKNSWSTEVDIYQLPHLNSHANVLQFIGAEKRGDNINMDLWLITEFHEHSSLYDYLKGNVLTWTEMLLIAETMTRGLSFLHSDIPPSATKGRKPAVAHRDFKSKNVLVKSDMTACVADFGLAIKFEPGSNIGETHGQVGTRRYMAPEVLEGAINFNRDAFMRIDMHACGLVLWELVSRCSALQENVGEYQLPLEDEVGTHPTLEEMQKVVVNRKMRPAFKESWYKHEGLAMMCETIEECWDQDPDARLSAGCVLERIIQLSSVPLNTPSTPPLITPALPPPIVVIPRPPNYPPTPPPSYSDPAHQAPPSYNAV